MATKEQSLQEAEYSEKVPSSVRIAQRWSCLLLADYLPWSICRTTLEIVCSSTVGNVASTGVRERVFTCLLSLLRSCACSRLAGTHVPVEQNNKQKEKETLAEEDSSETPGVSTLTTLTEVSLTFSSSSALLNDTWKDTLDSSGRTHATIIHRVATRSAFFAKKEWGDQAKGENYSSLFKLENRKLGTKS